jgi:subtilisin family serine protease
MLSKRSVVCLIAACLLLQSAGTLVFAQSSQQFENVIIQAPKPHTKLVADIRALGGNVTHEYKNVGAVAASVPASAMDALRKAVGTATISKDITVPAPRTTTPSRSVRGNSASPIKSLRETATAAPAAYSLNNLGLNLPGLHDQGFTGAGTIVAVVDSGIRPGFPVLESDGSVIGGIDLVGDGLGFSNPGNDPHGTFVAGLISGNTFVNIAQTPLETSVKQHFPGALVGTDLPLIGSAPAASIYVVRVFGANAQAGAPESRLIAAIDHVIDLKKKYLQGDPTGLNVQVCNLSLGNTTLFAGRDVFDQSVDALLTNGIVPVVSSGDAGPAGLTVSSPATSLSSIAVGSASPAANERVQADLLNFLGYGIHYRPSAATQVAWFSGRGPNADGRSSPDLVAIGVGNFGQGYSSPTSVDVVSGTSFSAPLVAGVAAVLRQAYPAANATQIRNAIIGSGNPSIVAPGFTKLDQGNGFPDAQAAYTNFSSFPGILPPILPPLPLVATNIKRGADLNLANALHTQATGNLAPGQRTEILYRVQPFESQVVITISNFASNPNVSPQNVFPEELYFVVHSSETSQIGAFGDYYNLGNPFITGGTFTINNPEPGIMRITVSGSWTNESAVSATVNVDSATDTVLGFTTHGTIDHHEQITYPVSIPAGVKVAEFRLWFRDDWASYPTSDLDMTLFDPNLVPNTDGAHLNAPELATVSNPLPGTWYVVIKGFDIPAGSDKYELRITLDGKLVLR